jgi:tetratricopeptide (TPR) repeat protein
LCYSFFRQPAVHASAMRAFVVTAALLAAELPAALAFAQTNASERMRVEGDVKHYKGMITAYRGGNDDVVAELLRWDETRLAKTIGAINSTWDPTRPWNDEFLRSGALLQTAAGLAARDAGQIDRMKFHFNLGVEQLRKGAPDLQPFAGRWYYAISRMYRSHGVLGVFDAERLLEKARQHVPTNPLVLYESATIEELRATDWSSAYVPPRSGTHVFTPFGSFDELDALGEILKDRATRLQNARDWLRQSVGTAPTALARLHYGRVLMMRKEDEEALLQLDAVRKDTTDRATQYLAILFTAALHERSGRLDLAARAYQQAIECFPESDAARIGLSQVLQASGGGDQARTILRELLKPRAERHDPWTWYFLEPKSVAQDRLAALFEEGRQ